MDGWSDEEIEFFVREGMVERLANPPRRTREQWQRSADMHRMTNEAHQRYVAGVERRKTMTPLEKFQDDMVEWNHRITLERCQRDNAKPWGGEPPTAEERRIQNLPDPFYSREEWEALPGPKQWELYETFIDIHNTLTAYEKRIMLSAITSYRANHREQSKINDRRRRAKMYGVLDQIEGKQQIEPETQRVVTHRLSGWERSPSAEELAMVALPEAYLTRESWRHLSESEQWDALQLYATEELQADLSPYERELYQSAFESYRHDYPDMYEKRSQRQQTGGLAGFSEAEASAGRAAPRKALPPPPAPPPKSSAGSIDQIRQEMGYAPPPKPKKKK